MVFLVNPDIDIKLILYRYLYVPALFSVHYLYFTNTFLCFIFSSSSKMMIMIITMMIAMFNRWGALFFLSLTGVLKSRLFVHTPNNCCTDRNTYRRIKILSDVIFLSIFFLSQLKSITFLFHSLQPNDNKM